jgi:hypothetical protein
MNITEHRLELQPEAEQASDFIAALVAHYESQIDELKQRSSIAFLGMFSLSQSSFKNSILATPRPRLEKLGDSPRGFAKECHNAHAPRDGQARGVVTRSVESGASRSGSRVPRARAAR